MILHIGTFAGGYIMYTYIVGIIENILLCRMREVSLCSLRLVKLGDTMRALRRPIALPQYSE